MYTTRAPYYLPFGSLEQSSGLQYILSESVGMIRV